MGDVLDKLKGGDRRSIGRADEVVADVLEDPKLFDAVVKGMRQDDPVVRMRAVDVAEKVTRVHREVLQRYKAMLLYEIAQIEQQEVRWHVAQMLPRLELRAKERAEAVRILLGYLEDESKIVKTESMQALADMAAGDALLQESVIPLLEELTRTGSPAIRSRGRKLLARF